MRYFKNRRIVNHFHEPVNTREKLEMLQEEIPKSKIAAIDIGSNSAHLIITEIGKSGELRIIEKAKVTLRLANALDQNNNLSRAGIERTVDAIDKLSQIVAKHNAMTRIVATHAVRAAKNQAFLIQRIEETTHLKVEILDGLEEARLCFLGVRYGLKTDDASCLMVDIGGGSTEILIGADSKTSFVHSLKLGCLTLTNHYLGSKTYQSQKIIDLQEYIRACLAPLCPEIERHSFRKAIAASGTAKAIAQIHALFFNRTPITAQTGYKVSREELFAITKRLAELGNPNLIQEKTKIDGMRSEVILAGALIFTEITKLFQVNEWIISTYGLREGVIIDTAKQLSLAHAKDFNELIWQGVLSIANRFEIDHGHANQVKQLALQIFHGLIQHIECPGIETQESAQQSMKILKTAAYLSEVGKFINPIGYHKHSHYILKNSEIQGLSESERATLGLVVKFHRKQAATKANCPNLTPIELRQIQFLSGCLRLAAALSKYTKNQLLNIIPKSASSELKFELYFDSNSDYERKTFNVERELKYIEKTFKIKVSLEPARGEKKL